jgi:hypothetical protein
MRFIEMRSVKSAFRRKRALSQTKKQFTSSSAEQNLSVDSIFNLVDRLSSFYILLKYPHKFLHRYM